MKIRILLSRITLAFVFICILTVAYAQSSPKVLEDMKTSLAIGDTMSARHSLVDMIRDTNENRKDNDAGTVLNEQTNASPKALERGADVANTSVSVMQSVTDYANKTSDPFITPIIGNALSYARDRAKTNEETGPVRLAGLPEDHIRAAITWRDRLASSDKYGPMMKDYNFQMAASGAVALGFAMSEDPAEQNAFTLGLLESAARLSLNKSPDVHARYVNAMVDGVRVALSKNKMNENGEPIPDTGFSGKRALSPSAVLAIMEQITIALSEGVHVNPAQLTGVMASAFNTYSSLIDSDAVYFASPETYTAIAEIAVNMALRPLGLSSSLSRVSRNYLSVSSGRELAVASMECAARDRGDSYIATSGAFSIIAQGISKKVMTLALNNENKPAWDAMQEAGMTFADLIAYASDPNDGHKKLRGMTANDGSRVFTDNTLSIFKREVFLGVEAAAMQRSQATGLNYDTEKTKLFTSIFR